jgi:hypothetical protein
MLAPESQMIEKVDSLFKELQNLEGTCKATQKHDGESASSGEVLQSEYRLQSSVDAVLMLASANVLAAAPCLTVKLWLPML